ncbi:hypothetical protein X797_008868 [Metarhizium robertsii]|uniref:Uncharacterized protein n=1 Tax=Metarhizium robertsii TaxID=568076 RepID=A0A014N016_9HYPO|nr:hypothetical protein X797_008868 [Metarhizium robertsii]
MALERSQPMGEYQGSYRTGRLNIVAAWLPFDGRGTNPSACDENLTKASTYCQRRVSANHFDWSGKMGMST